MTFLMAFHRVETRCYYLSFLRNSFLEKEIMTLLIALHRVKNPLLVPVVPTELFAGKRDNDSSDCFSPG